MAAAGFLNPGQVADLQRAFGLLQAGRSSAALPIALELVRHAPAAPDTQHLLALCQAEAGRWQASAVAFRAALALAPDQVAILNNYAAMLRRAGQPRDAVVIAERAVAAAPASAQAWISLATSRTESGDPASARTAAQRALALAPDSITALQLLGAAARAEGDLDTADAALRRVVERDPAQRASWMNLGAVQRLAGRPDLALSSYAHAGRLHPGEVELEHAVVGALLDLGRIDEAAQRARRIVDANPRFTPGLTTLAQLVWEFDVVDDRRRAVADLFEAAMRGSPQDREIPCAYVRFLLSADAADAALEQVGVARRMHGDGAALRLLEAQALEALDRTVDADAVYMQLMGEGGDRSPVVLNASSRNALRAGEYGRAADFAERATRLAPDDQQAWAYLGTAWRLLGDEREAWLCDYERLVGLMDIEPAAPDGREAFLARLAAALEPLHRARNQPLEQSVRGGSQTRGRLFGRPIAEVAQAHAALMEGIERWLSALPRDPHHPFLRRNRGSVRIGGSWSVKLWSAGRHANHIHSEGWMSSAFYVALPPSMAGIHGDGDAGAIQFGQPPTELGLDLPPRRIIRPRVGQLALFPSFFWHGTVPFRDDAPRITMAFDMTPNVRAQA